MGHLDQPLGRLLRLHAADKSDDDLIRVEAELRPRDISRRRCGGGAAVHNEREMVTIEAELPGVVLFGGGAANNAIRQLRQDGFDGAVEETLRGAECRGFRHEGVWRVENKVSAGKLEQPCIGSAL